MNNIKLYSVAAIRQLEEKAIQSGISAQTLMQRAGLASYHFLAETWPTAKHIAVVCGKGNNAGDGLVLAQAAKEHGYSVTIICCTKPSELSGLAAEHLATCKAKSIPIMRYATDQSFKEYDVIVDAIFGIGLNATVEEPYATVIEAINASARPVLALDVPSGLIADTGFANKHTITASATLTMIALKRGLLTFTGPAKTGEVAIAELDLPQEWLNEVEASADVITWLDVRSGLPCRPKEAHKGNFGHVLVIGGDYGMGGAVRMSAEAAMRVGAGLVSVATRPEHVSVVTCSRPEIMCHQVSTGDELKPLIDKATVVVLGPGLGQSDWAQELLHMVLSSNKPMVLDADALNLLSQHPEQRDNWILTPHPGEAARLLKTVTEDIQKNRFAAVTDIQNQYGGVAVLKGTGTLVKDDDDLPHVCRAGNPGMATGGMGDILSGVIGGLLAQGLSLKCAATIGVFVHAIAADRAAEDGGERGLLATDLLCHLRHLVNPNQH